MALGLAVFLPGVAVSKSLSDAELAAIEKRLAPIEPYRAKLAIEEGGTVVIERTVEVSANRIKKPPSNYEAIVTGIVAPKGVVVHPRMDSFTLTPGGANTKVTYRYVVHVDPGTRSGGRARMTLSLVERTGFANVIHKEQVTHWFDVKSPAPKPEDLAADFWGHRHFESKMNSAIRTLKRSRLSGLSTQDNARLPSLSRASAKVAALALEMSSSRTRMWAAHRHLVVGLQSLNTETAGLARTYLGSLNKKDAELTSLPNVAIVAGAPVAVAEPPPPATVERLEPIATEPGPNSPPGTKSTLAPEQSYDLGSEDDEGSDALPNSSRPRPPPSKSPPVAAAPPKGPGTEPKVEAPPPSGTVVLSDDPFEGRRIRNVTYIPGYFRSLVLDDPNIAHGGSVRMAWANVKLREAAVASAFFFNGQVALTRFFGIEVTVPVEYVNVDVDRARSLFAMGNPLLAAKWRLYLPKIEGRAPVLTLRGRWAIPVTPLRFVPPTTLGAEDFSREPHFADTYAFFLEKTAIGTGANAAWQYDMFQFGLQLYFDYFAAVESALDQTSFLTLSYGASFGVLPFGDLVGFFAEARAVSLFAGPRRTEFFAYLGARGRFAEFIEPALWVAYPLGSVSRVSGLQLGVEIRFSYDLEAIVDTGRRAGRGDGLLQ